MTFDVVMALSDERDRAAHRAWAAERRGYDRGRRDGYRQGYTDGAETADREWMEALAPARAAARQIASGPDRVEIDRRVAAAVALGGCDAQNHWRAWWRRVRGRAADPAQVRAAQAIAPGRRGPEEHMVLALATRRTGRQRGAA